MAGFRRLYEMQIGFQKELIEKGCYDFLFMTEAPQDLPCDNSRISSYHIQQLVSEIGEVLSSDKRWKTHRSGTTEEMLAHKKEELADCFIVLMNLCMFSNLSADEILSQVESKIKENHNRIAR